jgi:hypothetical protein
MKKFELTLTGTRSLLMHNSRLADKLDTITQEKAKVTAKRKKTEDDDLLISHLEWQGGLYFDAVAGPYLPGDNVFKALVEAARKTKDGKRVEQGLLIETEVNPLAYDGPRDLEGLWADKNFVHRCTVKQGMVRVTRTRPVFKSWATVIEGSFDEEVFDLADLERFAQTAGLYIGVGDWRPKHGRFLAEVAA